VSAPAKPQLLTFPCVPHALGDLTFVDGERALPFAIRRVYYVTGMPEAAVRGGHAHKRTWEVLVAAAGGFDVRLRARDGASQRFRLDDPRQALLVPPLHWVRLDHYAPGSVCLVLASQHYEEADYLRDWDAFVAFGGEP
jgi:WxcM-like, C-terminal